MPLRFTVEMHFFSHFSTVHSLLNCLGLSKAHDNQLDALFQQQGSAEENVEKNQRERLLWNFQDEIKIFLFHPDILHLYHECATSASCNMYDVITLYHTMFCQWHT